MALRSELFRGDAKLEAAAVSDPAHIVEGATGEHVRKIQLALIQLDGAAVDLDGKFGPATARAVLAYKQKRNIINRSYQSQADNIVGKMTITSLDNEILSQPPVRPVTITPLSQFRITPPLSPLVAFLFDGPPNSQLRQVRGGNPPSAPVTGPPQISPQTSLEIRRNGSGSIEVRNGKSGTIQVADPAIAKIRTRAGAVGTSFVVRNDPERFDILGGRTLGKTAVTVNANGSSASITAVVKTFGGPPKFHEGVHHDHTPSRKFDDVIRSPNNSGKGTLKAILDKTCVGLVALADAPISLPHGPELLVAAARPALAVRAGLVASAHLEFYLSGSGKDFVENTNIKDWVTADSGIRAKLKGAIFPVGAKPRLEGEFFFGQGAYATDRTSQDFRFAFGSIDFVSFEVDLASNLVRVFFKDRYEWHPFYPKLYPVKTGDVARDDNCLHAALVEMQDQGAADYWMVGVAEVPLSLIRKP
jgi:peptidoglycan hydrolase-like protein with peptidoglycan-binding domain